MIKRWNTDFYFGSQDFVKLQRDLQEESQANTKRIRKLRATAFQAVDDNPFGDAERMDAEALIASDSIHSRGL